MDRKEKDRAELDLLLSVRARRTLGRFRLITAASLLASAGLLTFLLITCLRRLEDPLYLANNIALGAIALPALVSGLISWSRLRDRRTNQPLKAWLEERITLLSRNLSGSVSLLHFVVMPLIPVSYTHLTLPTN